MTGRDVVRGVFLLFVTTSPALAQHEAHVMPVAPTTVLGIPMDRGGSGTSWIPDAVRVPSRHFTAGNWMLMLHGFAFLQYDRQSGPRGDDQFGSLNWGMFMASRPLGRGTIQARTMLSLDAWTSSARGYPLLLQTGETYGGVPIVDRQHPHDFWKELAVMYERPITDKLAMVLYGGPSGEPALGPVAFMHRPSGMDGPTAPLGHHQQDATHISYGVATAGLFTRTWKLEASAFNGREPDESRFTIDKPRLDSWSGRFTVNPNANWSVSLGYGYFASPEALHPDESARRIVGSAQHGVSVGSDGQWASTLVVGANHQHDGWIRSVLFESELIAGANTWNTRVEALQRTAEELDAAAFPPERVFAPGAVSLGYIRDFARTAAVSTGLGARATLNIVPKALEATYGSRFPTGLFVFLRVRPSRSVRM